MKIQKNYLIVKIISRISYFICFKKTESLDYKKLNDIVEGSVMFSSRRAGSYWWEIDIEADRQAHI